MYMINRAQGASAMSRVIFGRLRKSIPFSSKLGIKLTVSESLMLKKDPMKPADKTVSLELVLIHKKKKKYCYYFRLRFHSTYLLSVLIDPSLINQKRNCAVVFLSDCLLSSSRWV